MTAAAGVALGSCPAPSLQAATGTWSLATVLLGRLCVDPMQVCQSQEDGLQTRQNSIFPGITRSALLSDTVC